MTARAPAVGDMRFQQVDAPYIVNGWANAGGLSTAVTGRGAFTYSSGVGTPLYAGSAGDCAVPITSAEPALGSHLNVRCDSRA
jgi:hypothetical protein